MSDETTYTSNPPAWAEAIVQTVLERRHRESISGDLLEEYRESVLPARGRHGADSWYVRQALGFLWRATWWWGAMLAVAVIARSAFDWFVPPETFYARSLITTYTAIALFLAAGSWTAWRTGSVRASVLAGIAMGAISAAFELAASLVTLGVWHDQHTLWAIQRSGGLGEVFTLPILVVVPGVIVAAVGGAVGKGAASFIWRRAS